MERERAFEGKKFHPILKINYKINLTRQHEQKDALASVPASMRTCTRAQHLPSPHLSNTDAQTKLCPLAALQFN